MRDIKNELNRLYKKERNYLETHKVLEKIKENNKQNNIDINYQIVEYQDNYYIEVVHD
ncbi:hypothetical protein [Mammaliicoccus vitulinus]|uniref:hypothetical protein n=1 Tax=Mammaliicoccus vitulinus TaxID=71237 RepID=UPI001867AA86|nr:hypothetical protein [Mammaliicoccus vitulinus]